MIEWTLAICTAAWGLCGVYKEVTYQTEEQCYRALDELYKRHGAKEFKYVICEPRKVPESANAPKKAVPAVQKEAK